MRGEQRTQNTQRQTRAVSTVSRLREQVPSTGTLARTLVVNILLVYSASRRFQERSL